MKNNSFQTFSASGLLACVLLLFTACGKNGGLMKATEVVNVTITSFSANTEAAFVVLFNGNVVEDSLYTGHSSTRLAARVEGMQHVVVRDYFTGAMLLDTSIDISGKTASLTLLQLDMNIPPVLMGQSDDDTPENFRNQAIFYNEDILPDSVAFQVYACHYDPNDFTLSKIDTIATFEKIKKGTLSGFVSIPVNPDPSLIIYLYQLLDVDTLEPLANMGTVFDPENYIGYQFSFDPAPTGTEKNYFNKLTTTGNAELFDVYCDRVISY